MTLRLRIAVGFATVALATAAAVALATPHIVSQGLSEFESDLEATPTPAPIFTVAPSSGTNDPALVPGEPEPSERALDPELSEAPGGDVEPSGEAARDVPDSHASPAEQHPDAVSGADTSASGGEADPLPSASPSAESPHTSRPMPSGALTIVAATPHPALGGAPAAPRPARTASAAPALDDDAAQDAAALAAAARSQVEQDTTARLVAVGLLAALAASILGLILAGRLTRPLSLLEAAAEAVAGGDLTQRSGLARRGDEFGQLGRSFDAMAAELQKADENRRRFLQDAAHELRTPLTVIETTSSAIIDGVYTAERRHLETIREQSRLLSRIVDDLRTISQAEVGRLPLDRERFVVQPALRSVARAFEVRAVESGARIAIEDADGLAVYADPDRFRQMLAAVLDNALRHSPRGSETRIAAVPLATAVADTRTQQGGRFVRIAVEDAGPGIPSDELQSVFERFYQGDPAPDRHVGTSGLGLSIVRALAEAQGGRVGAENRPEGGARVWFDLPRG